MQIASVQLQLLIRSFFIEPPCFSLYRESLVVFHFLEGFPLYNDMNGVPGLKLGGCCKQLFLFVGQYGMLVKLVRCYNFSKLT